MLLADAERRERLMLPLSHLLRLRTGQDIDDMADSDTETTLLLDAKNTREELLRRQGAVNLLARSEPVVAGPAGIEGLPVSPLVGLSEVFQELDAAASGALTKLNELRQVFASNCLLFLIGDTVDEAVKSH